MPRTTVQTTPFEPLSCSFLPGNPVVITYCSNDKTDVIHGPAYSARWIGVQCVHWSKERDDGGWNSRLDGTVNLETQHETNGSSLGLRPCMGMHSNLSDPIVENIIVITPSPFMGFQHLLRPNTRDPRVTYPTSPTNNAGSPDVPRPQRRRAVT